MNLALNLQSIVLLLFFIAPGFLFTRTYSAYRPRYYRDPTAFEQFVLAIVGSTIIHAALLSVVSIGVLGYWVFAGQLLYATIVFDPAVPLLSYPLTDLAQVIFGSVVYLAVSLVMARRIASFLGQTSAANRPRWWRAILGQDPPEPFLLWHTVLQIEPLQLNLIPPQLTVQMRSGERFEGELYRFRLVGDEENTVELALRNVSYTASATETVQEEQKMVDQVLLLKSSDIRWLTRNDIPR